jgi:hypothetical protein
MPVIAEIVGLLISIVFLLGMMKRNGITCSSCMSALHRSRWRKKMNVNPLYCLSDPRDMVTALLVSLIKSTGEITSEQKQVVLRTLRKQFMISDEEAGHCFAQGSFLMRDSVDILDDADKILAPIAGKCTPAQVASMRHMLNDVATEEGKAAPNAYQQALIEKVMHIIDPPPPAI